MSDKRNSLEDEAGAFAAAVVGALFSLGLGWFVGKQVKKRRDETIQFSDTLELELGKNYAAKRQTAPGHRGVVFVVGMFFFSMYTLLFVVGGILVLIFRRDVVVALLMLGMGVFFGYGTIGIWSENQRIRRAAALSLRSTSQQGRTQPLDASVIQIYSIRVPKKTEWEPERARSFMQQLLQKVGRLTFQIIADQNIIQWQIVDHRHRAERTLIENTIRTFYPEAEIQVNGVSEPPFEQMYHRYVMAFEQPVGFLAPILTVNQMATLDPLATLTEEMSKLQCGERVVYTLFVADPARYLYEQAEGLLTIKADGGFTKYFTPQGLFEAAYAQNAGETRVDRYDESEQRIAIEKLHNFVYQCLLLIQVDAPTPERVRELATLDSHVTQFRSPNPPYNFLLWHQDNFPDCIQQITSYEHAWNTSTLARLNRWLTNQDASWQKIRLLLDTRELAALWHLPHVNCSAPTIRFIHGKQVQIPTQLKGVTEGVYLGENVYAGQRTPVYLPDSSRATPMMIIGKAGVGKSNLMHYMIHQDIEQGKSVVVIDPHGTLVQDILQCSIPPEREADVVVLDLANRQNPPPLNPLRGLTGEVAVARTVDILHKLYPDLKDLPQTMDALENAILTLQVLPDATLWDVDRLFSDDGFRRLLLAQITDPVLQRFWCSEYESLTAAQQIQLSAPITRRIRRFYRSEALRAVICHKDGIDFAELVQQRKIVLVSLRTQESVIAEQEQRLVGALLISRLQMAALSNAFLQNPCYCFVDELQNFVTTSIDQVFSEARKFKLLMTMANQYLHQLKGDALEGAMSNVGTLVVFQVGVEDARVLASYTRPTFDADDLTKLDKYNMALWTRVGDKTERAFSVVTRPPIPLMTNPVERERRLRQSSVETYTPVTSEAVLKWLDERDKKMAVEHVGSEKEHDDWYDTTGNLPDL